MARSFLSCAQANTAPIAVNFASVYKMYGCFTSGKVMIGADDKYFFKVSSASCVSSVRVNELLVSLASCSGCAIQAKFLIDRL